MPTCLHSAPHSPPNGPLRSPTVHPHLCRGTLVLTGFKGACSTARVRLHAASDAVQQHLLQREAGSRADCNSSSSHALPHKLPWAIYLTAGRSPKATSRDLNVSKSRTPAQLAGRKRAKLDGRTDHVTQAFLLTESEVSCARTGAQQFATTSSSVHTIKAWVAGLAANLHDFCPLCSVSHVDGTTMGHCGKCGIRLPSPHLVCQFNLKRRIADLPSGGSCVLVSGGALLFVSGHQGDICTQVSTSLQQASQGEVNLAA